MIGGLQRLLITALLITPQKTGHRGPYFDWLRAQGQQVRFGVLFLIKGAINHLHTSEMRRRFRKGPFHSSRGYHPFSRSKTQSRIAPTLSKKRQSQISDRGKVGSNLPIQGVSLKFRGFIFPLFFAGCTSTRWQSSPNTFHSSHKLDRVCVAVALLSSSVPSSQCLRPPSCIHLSPSFVNSSQCVRSD